MTATRGDVIAFASPPPNGFFVGGGVEQVLSRNVSLKFEYRFSDYDDVTVAGTKFDNEVHSVRLGVNYKFGR